MIQEFKLPELGENVSAGTIAKILVKVGDAILAGQNVLEIETDKAVADIPCPFGGKVTEIRVQESQKVSAGTVVLLVDTAAAGAAQQASSPVQAVAPAPAPTVGSQETSTAILPEKKAAAPIKPTVVKASAGSVRAAPSVRQLAREHDVDLAEVPVSDPSGKITARDVLDFVAARSALADGPAESVCLKETEISAPYGTFDKWGRIEEEPMNAIRGKAAEHLSNCWTTIPHVTHFDKADITELELFREKYARKADAKGAKLTITAFLLKVLPEALKAFPRFNASLDMEKKMMVLKQYYHLGVAVDTPNGLVVPVLRHVDKISVLDIAREMNELAQKARDRKLTLENMQGGTFTVSNLGGLGGYAFTPIINSPETAILGVSRSQFEPVYRDGAFVPRLMLPLSLSYDHRIIDGADAARFLRFVAESLEQPWRAMLGL